MDARYKPDFEECLSKKIVDDLSRCLAHNVNCVYAVPAGVDRTFCQHPGNKMDLPYGFLSRQSADGA